MLQRQRFFLGINGRDPHCYLRAFVTGHRRPAQHELSKLGQIDEDPALGFDSAIENGVFDALGSLVRDSSDGQKRGSWQVEAWWGHVLALDGEPDLAACLGSEDVQVNVRGAVGYAVTHQFLERLVVAGFCPVAQDVAKALPLGPVDVATRDGMDDGFTLDQIDVGAWCETVVFGQEELGRSP